jgi:hypothetical protein
MALTVESVGKHAFLNLRCTISLLLRFHSMSPLPALSPAGTLVDGEPKGLPRTRKLVLLVIFCLVQFLDDFNYSALFSAIPAIEISMGMTESQSTWILTASQLTFASFLLIVRVYPRVLTCTSTYCFRVVVSATYTTQVSAMPLC